MSDRVQLEPPSTEDATLLTTAAAVPGLAEPQQWVVSVPNWVVVAVVVSVVSVLAVFVILKIVAKLTVRICRSQRDLSGKTVIVTGGNTRMGLEIARELARRNAHLILGCRDVERGRVAAADLVASTGNPNVDVKKLDPLLLASVRQFAAEVLGTESRLDVLISNDTLVGGRRLQRTSEGLEAQLAANHLAPFLLINLLVPLLQKCAPSRVVIVSSTWHRFGLVDAANLNSERSYNNPLRVFCNTKLANLLFSMELARRIRWTKVTVNACCTGLAPADVTRTQCLPVRFLGRLTEWCIGKSAWEAAQTPVYLAVSENLEDVSGKFFRDCRECKMSGKTVDNQLASNIWEMSESLTGFRESVA